MMERLEPLAYLLGRAIVAYGIGVVRPDPSKIRGLHQFPTGPAVFLGWHSANLLTLGLVAGFGPRTYSSFVPQGLIGAAMRGQLVGTGQIDTVVLSKHENGSLRAALRFMSDALGKGNSVMFAGDGPSGPYRVLRPGAAWLARQTGYPLVPVGFGSWPALRLPRWDRQIIPLPGSRVRGVVGAPIYVERRQRVDDALLALIQDRLNDVTDQASAFARWPSGVRRAALPSEESK
jgi:lysophospholipid acyltransferase (LPLAT)-like uncharacterized protein